MEEKIEYVRTSYLGNRIELVSKKGNRTYNGKLGNKKQDRLFFIRLVSGKEYLNTKNGEKEQIKIEFPYSYGDQHRMMELVMNNIIFDHIFEAEYKTFITLMENIKKNRKKKDKKLADFGGK